MVAVQVKTIQDAVRNKKQRSSPFLAIACSLMFCLNTSLSHLSSISSHSLTFYYFPYNSISHHFTPFSCVLFHHVYTPFHSIPLFMLSVSLLFLSISPIIFPSSQIFFCLILFHPIPCHPLSFSILVYLTSFHIIYSCAILICSIMLRFITSLSHSILSCPFQILPIVSNLILLFSIQFRTNSISQLSKPSS